MSKPNSKASEGLIDNIWGLLIDSSRMQFLDEYMGDMNAPLMITMGAMSMPQTNEELADALGVSKSEALKFISQWAYDNGITDHQLYTESKASEGRYKVEDKTYDDLEEAKVMADMTDNPVLDSQEDNRPIYDGGTYRTESKASEYYGENEPDKLLPTIRCEKCHDIIRGEFDQETKQKAHDHLINEHQYTWLPTKRKFEHDEQNRVYQKMMSNMEYSKANYSNSVFESKASEGRSLEQVWNQASPSEREGIMIEGGIEYEETGQSYFGDDGNDSDSLLHNLDDSGTDSGRWSAQNKSAMDSLSNTSYDNLPINIKDRVDSGIISYGLYMEGESKANEVSIDDFKRIKDNLLAEKLNFEQGSALVDIRTANAIVAVWDNINEEQRLKFPLHLTSADNVARLAGIAFKSNESKANEDMYSDMSLSEFLGQWDFTMDDAKNVAERLGISNLEELKNLGDDFFYHANNYHEEMRSLKQEADDEFKWSEEDRIKRGISTDDYYKLNESKASEDDPDFDNDADFEGKINGASVEPSQYTQSGMDHTDYGRGDIDESKASEFNTQPPSVENGWVRTDLGDIEIFDGRVLPSYRLSDPTGDGSRDMEYVDLPEGGRVNLSVWVRESKASEAGLEDHVCAECGFVTSDNSEYIDHLNSHEE